MNETRKMWLEAIGEPSYEMPSEPLVLRARYDDPEFEGELYDQANDKNKSQRLLMLFPKHRRGPCPAVAVPFYIAEMMLGFDPANGREYTRYQQCPIMLDLLRRGYAVASADAYHVTYYKSEREKMDFARWGEAAEILLKDHPHWSGIGKLVSDTRLMIDALCQDPRVDAKRIGIAGFSLGGKMAFYTGCLDERIRAILAVDFGFGWHQSNWDEKWYWGEKLKELIAHDMDHTQLLSSTNGKPMCLLGGEFDDDESWNMMQRAANYPPEEGKLVMKQYPGGHLPTTLALETGYRFLDQWVKG